MQPVSTLQQDTCAAVHDCNVCFLCVWRQRWAKQKGKVTVKNKLVVTESVTLLRRLLKDRREMLHWAEFKSALHFWVISRRLKCSTEVAYVSRLSADLYSGDHLIAAFVSPIGLGKRKDECDMIPLNDVWRSERVQITCILSQMILSFVLQHGHYGDGNHTEKRVTGQTWKVLRPLGEQRQMTERWSTKSNACSAHGPKTNFNLEDKAGGSRSRPTNWTQYLPSSDTQVSKCVEGSMQDLVFSLVTDS